MASSKYRHSTENILQRKLSLPRLAVRLPDRAGLGTSLRRMYRVHLIPHKLLVRSSVLKKKSYLVALQSKGCTHWRIARAETIDLVNSIDPMHHHVLKTSLLFLSPNSTLAAQIGLFLPCDRLHPPMHFQIYLWLEVPDFDLLLHPMLEKTDSQGGVVRLEQERAHANVSWSLVPKARR